MSAACPVCGGGRFVTRWRTPRAAVVEAGEFRPSSNRYGDTVGDVAQCSACAHSWVVDPPADSIADAYAHAADDDADAEHDALRANAQRTLDVIERWHSRGDLLDIGCWTGTLLEAAASRGWRVHGLEPSAWAAAVARARGVQVTVGALDESVPAGAFDVVVAGDVLEHFADPASATGHIRRALRPEGVLYLTLPDAGSAVARVLGARWWSVLPMHLQYFTRASLTMLLERHGFAVLSVTTHPKSFSAAYYIDRAAAFLPGMPAPLVDRVRGTALARRRVTPDFHDRMEVVARLVS